MTEPLAALFVVAYVLLHLRARSTGTAASWALAGALLTLVNLTKVVLYYLPPIVLLEILWTYRRDRAALGRAAGGFLLGVLGALAPWTLRNAVVLGRFLPLVDVQGYELFVANYLPPEDEIDAYAPLPPTELVGRLYAAAEAERTPWLAEHDAETAARIQWDAGLANLRRYAVDHPDLLVKLVLGKLASFWLLPERFVGPYPFLGRSASDAFLVHWPTLRVAFMVFAAIGFVSLWARPGPSLALAFASLGLYHLALSVATLSEPRYHVHLAPVFAVLAAIGVFAAVRAPCSRARRVPWRDILEWSPRWARRL
jgi:hypothetical protein